MSGRVEMIPAVVFRGGSRRRFTEHAAYKDAAGEAYRAGHWEELQDARMDARDEPPIYVSSERAHRERARMVVTVERLARLFYRLDHGRWPRWPDCRGWWR